MITPITHTHTLFVTGPGPFEMEFRQIIVEAEVEMTGACAQMQGWHSTM